jgi:hypothetical protein
MGHTMSVHSRNEDVILQFGLKKPAFRICVNTPTTHGSIGLTTGLDPAMTLGCGGWGGNITSDNISPKHLLNIKRLAYEVRPAPPSATMARSPGQSTVAPADPSGSPGVGWTQPAPLPKVRVAPSVRGIPAQTLSARIDEFLASRGYKPPSGEGHSVAGNPTGTGPQLPSSTDTPPAASSSRHTPADFVCEDDVRTAVRIGTKILVGEKTIITPAARDLGEAHKVFVQGGWPS